MSSYRLAYGWKWMKNLKTCCHNAFFYISELKNSEKLPIELFCPKNILNAKLYRSATGLGQVWTVNSDTSEMLKNLQNLLPRWMPSDEPIDET